MLCTPWRFEIACALWLAIAAAAGGADWPTYLHDAARSGVTAESLAWPLAQQWVFQPRAAPAAGWGAVEQGAIWKLGIPFQQSVRYDDAYHVAAVGDNVYFAASAEHAVYCLDAARAAIRWVAFTGAPARCAPAVHDGKVYVGADDGCVYCFDAPTGATLWQRTVAPHGDRVIGHGRIMSLWPVRTSVVVDGQRAYFAAGLYPNYGVKLCAVRADNGDEIWTQSDFGRGEAPSPQGYLLADQQRIVVPSGRTFPVVLDRESGRLRGRITAGRCPPNGGSYAVLAGDELLNGVNCMTAYDMAAKAKDKWGRDVFAPPAWSWFKGQAAVVHGDMVYMVTDSDVFAIRRSDVAAACGPTTGFDTNTRPDVSKCLWRQTDQHVADALILAGGSLIAGGQDKVVAYDAAKGSVLWSASVEGRVRGLAVANGRLLASTTSGRIYSFGRSDGSKPITPPAAAPYPADRLSAFYARTAEAIVTQSGVGDGFCLVIGAASSGRPGQLAYELAKRTQLRIQLIEPDARRTAEVRSSLHAAGCYGTRVAVDCGTLATLSYPRFFADLVVSEEAFFGGPLRTSAAEFAAVLRPCGGVALVGQPSGGAEFGAEFGAALQAAALTEWLRGLGRSCVAEASGAWAVIRRCKLPGAAEWTHQGADPGNTYCSDDRLVKPPFGILWFGEPGSHHVLDRHAGGAAPLAVNGRLFVPGINTLMAYDAYNGRLLWQREIPNMHRERMPLDCSSLAADEDHVFVAAGPACVRLSAATGAEQQRYEIPARADGQKRLWGWIALEGNLLLGSRSSTPSRFKGWPKPSGNTSEALFAIDAATGKTLWTREAKGVGHNAIALIDGRLFFVDADAPEAARNGPTAPASAARSEGQDVRRLVALDAATGRELWQQPADVTDCVVHPRPGSGDCCGGEVALMGKAKTLVLCGSPYHADHELEPFYRGVMARRSLAAFNTQTGEKLWSRAANYQTRPIIVGQTIFAEPWTFDLATGKQQTDAAGEPTKMFRGSGCGGFAASSRTLFFRRGPLSYFDLQDRGEIQPLVGGQRPSCWISFVPAGGVVLAPEGSAGCTCAYPIQGTVALYPKDAPVDEFASGD